ncbi:MAG: protease SohB [Bdellovibrionia bacterium]
MEILIFAAKTFLILFSIIAIILLIAFLAAKSAQKPELEVELLHKKFKNLALLLKAQTLPKKLFKEELKKQKKSDKVDDESEDLKKRLFVIDFNGDIKAQAVSSLREEISSILMVATPQDEIVVRVESPGGVVHGYGLAAAQLLRIREKGIPLTVCVDKVAASGGYMMACVANKVMAAPFAIIGSIGVVAQVPNFHRILKKNDVDYKEYTAGEFKRTVSIFGEITEKGEEKFREQLEDTHVLFKTFVSKYRPNLKTSEVATGEYWYGERALEKGLVDELMTSDDYLLKHLESHQILKVAFKQKQKLGEKISEILSLSLQNATERIIAQLENRKLL